MACYSPLEAFRTASGDVVFSQLKRFDIVATLWLNCGQCVGCRLERSRQWATRCMHESSLHAENSFITLTYSPENLPPNSSLHYPDFQKFMKRLRKCISPRSVRYYMCGEYGEEFSRPHFHACLFGFDFPDKVYFKKTDSGAKLYRSKILEALWPFGYSTIGDVTFESAAYVARYVMKKVTGDAAIQHYERIDKDTGEITSLVPEFNFMSLKPGIGAKWFEKFGSDVYPGDFVVTRGAKSRPPRYYDKLLKKVLPDVSDSVKARRELDGLTRQRDNTRERLGVREQVASARLAVFKRKLK